jgi:hypothetical protein
MMFRRTSCSAAGRPGLPGPPNGRTDEHSSANQLVAFSTFAQAVIVRAASSTCCSPARFAATRITGAIARVRASRLGLAMSGFGAKISW